MDRSPLIADLVAAVSSGQQTAVELVEEALELAGSDKARDLNIFTEVLFDASQKAAEIDRRRQAGEPLGRLAGIPFAVKDNFLVGQTKTTAAAPILDNFVAPYTGTCVQRLLDEDAVLIGKTNLDAFAHGTTTENSAFGPTKNPANPAWVAGGSSGGSAAAVAAGVCPFALGTDTGGSVRLPASFCGAVGYKPTYGLLSRYGLVAMASSTDCPAIVANHSRDVVDLLAVMAGLDPFDGTTIELVDLKPEAPERPRVGVIKQFGQGLEPEVGAAIDRAKSLVESLGGELVEVDLPSLDLALACYYILVPAEVSSNLSRYDGLRYGSGLVDGDDISQVVSANRSAGFVAENKRRIMLGTYVLSSGYYEAYFERAQRVRRQLVDEFDRVFGRVDLLLSPVAPTTAFGLGSKTDPLALYEIDLMTVPASLAGLPAISLPIGGLDRRPPVGLQLIAPAGQDGLLLDWSARVEAAQLAAAQTEGVGS